MIDKNQLACHVCGRVLDGFPTFELRKHESNSKACVYLCFELSCLLAAGKIQGAKTR